jgi:arginine decarboxylase
MNQLATRYSLVTGSGEGDAPLTAFDAALLKATVGNYNLVRVSSVMPAGASYQAGFELPVGTVLYIAYGTYRSSIAGERLCAAIGVGRAPAGHGMIMEYAGPGTAEDAGHQVERMVRESFARRGWEVASVEIRTVEHVVDKNGAVFAGCPLW